MGSKNRDKLAKERLAALITQVEEIKKELVTVDQHQKELQHILANENVQSDPEANRKVRELGVGIYVQYLKPAVLPSVNRTFSRLAKQLVAVTWSCGKENKRKQSTRFNEIQEIYRKRKNVKHNKYTCKFYRNSAKTITWKKRIRLKESSLCS